MRGLEVCYLKAYAHQQHTITVSECSIVIRTGLVRLDPVVSHKLAPHCKLVDTIPDPNRELCKNKHDGSCYILIPYTVKTAMHPSHHTMLMQYLCDLHTTYCCIYHTMLCEGYTCCKQYIYIGKVCHVQRLSLHIRDIV